MIYGKLSVNHSFTISSSWLSQRTKLCQVKEEDKGASEARVQLSDLTIRLKDGRHFWSMRVMKQKPPFCGCG